MNFPLALKPGAAGANSADGISGLGSTTITGNTREEKLKKASVQFESMLVSSLWKDMEKTFGQSDSDQPGFDTMQDMGLRAMTTALAASGGIGIAKMIDQQVERQQAAVAAQQESGRGAGPLTKAQAAEKAADTPITRVGKFFPLKPKV
ncbi:MAG: rod-binding protein [Terriglobia bacterium]